MSVKLMNEIGSLLVDALSDSSTTVDKTFAVASLYNALNCTEGRKLLRRKPRLADTLRSSARGFRSSLNNLGRDPKLAESCIAAASAIDSLEHDSRGVFIRPYNLRELVKIPTRYEK